MALPRSSLVGRPLGGPPPGRGEARLKPCAAAAEGRAAGPIEARALGFLPFAPCTGDGPGLGLEGGLSDMLMGGGLCAHTSERKKREREEKKTKNKRVRSCFLVLFFFFGKKKGKGVAAVEMIRGGGRRRVGIVQ